MWHNQAIPNEFQFTLSGNLHELERLAAETERFCREHSLGAGAAFEINLALEELFTNALRHGECEGMEEAAHIRLEFRDGQVLVEFSDRGKAFDPCSAPVPDLELPLAGRCGGGLGIHLVRQIMPDLHFERSGEWNRITMRLNSL